MLCPFLSFPQEETNEQADEEWNTWATSRKQWPGHIYVVQGVFPHVV